MLSSVERDDLYIIWNNWTMSKILLAQWSVDFAMGHEREKLRMKETTNELASFISTLNLGSEEMPIEEYVQLAKEEFVDAK